YTLGNDLDCFLLGWDPYLSFEQAPMDLNLGFGPAISVPGVPGLIAALFALSWHELDPFEIPFSACGLLLPPFPSEAVGAFAMVGVDVDDVTWLIDDASHILTIIPFCKHSARCDGNENDQSSFCFFCLMRSHDDAERRRGGGGGRRSRIRGNCALLRACDVGSGRRDGIAQGGLAGVPKQPGAIAFRLG